MTERASISTILSYSCIFLHLCPPSYDALGSRSTKFHGTVSQRVVNGCCLSIITVTIIDSYVQYTYTQSTKLAREWNVIGSLEGKTVKREQRGERRGCTLKRNHVNYLHRHWHLREWAPKVPWERVDDITQLHLCQYSLACCIQPCLHRSGRSGIGGVGEAVGREAPQVHHLRVQPGHTVTVTKVVSSASACTVHLPSHRCTPSRTSAHQSAPFLYSHQLTTLHLLSLAGPSRHQSKISRPPSLPNTRCHRPY